MINRYSVNIVVDRSNIELLLEQLHKLLEDLYY